MHFWCTSQFKIGFKLWDDLPWRHRWRHHRRRPRRSLGCPSPSAPPYRSEQSCCSSGWSEQRQEKRVLKPLILLQQLRFECPHHLLVHQLLKLYLQTGRIPFVGPRHFSKKNWDKKDKSSTKVTLYQLSKSVNITNISIHYSTVVDLSVCPTCAPHNPKCSQFHAVFLENLTKSCLFPLGRRILDSLLE